MHTQTQPAAQKPRPLEFDRRYFVQNAKSSIRDLYDALLELITNADDRYVHLGAARGRIEIEVDRKRKGTASLIIVRDFADGMTAEVMLTKLAKVGGRVSGMKDGVAVRGTNSRGAKDIAVLGNVTFESIAADGRCHKCEITHDGQFVPYAPSPPVTAAIRKTLKIAKGTGTVVTLQVGSQYKVPLHDGMRSGLRNLVCLRDIVASPDREIVLIDARNPGRAEKIAPIIFDAEVVLKDSFAIPGYPAASAKLVLKRAKNPLGGDQQRFRRNGIVVKSKRGIHEATFFSSDLENDPDAQRFIGSLRCEYIDDLCNQYDETLENGLPETKDTRVPILDPLRRAGLAKDHPFAKALKAEVLKRLRPIVERERQQRNAKRGEVESYETRKRLGELEKEAARFMEKYREDEEPVVDADSRRTDSVYRKTGHSLNPPFAQLVVGQSCRFWLNINQEAHPEFATGDTVQIECATDEISAGKRVAQLEPHPSQEGVVRATWSIRGERVTKATAVLAHVGSLDLESTVEVLEKEIERYSHVKGLMFSCKRYRVPVEGTRRLKLYAPIALIEQHGRQPTFSVSGQAFVLSGDKTFTVKPDWGIGISGIRVTATREGASAQVVAKLGEQQCKAEVESRNEKGAPLQIRLVDDDFGNQRYRWKSNLLEIATRHPSLRRYLGTPPDFQGQDDVHFRVLVAEIVAEACCSRLVGRMVAANPSEYQDADWDQYYAEYSKLMTEFLPTAHQLQVSEL